MYLKSIEVQGFKSFANKIVFDFHNGITGIVGPNGSGKSNVADAVRWVLGEQSAKQLRGSKMEDVIFAGTQLRKPVGFAYVAITLDNSDHALPVEYDEVVVSRRVFRSGESEYMINGNSCRLKDVSEMFYDTGIGKEGYSIIGQGQIDRILSGKPEERRELFDEAAGIVKFKRRKAAAVKKLDSERANLVRVNDILSELEKQVGPLERQSEKARQYLKLKEELKINDVNAFLLEADKNKQVLAELEEKLTIASNHLEESNTAYENTKAEYEKAEQQLASVNEEIEMTSTLQNNTELDKNRLDGQINVLREQINTIQANEKHYNDRIEAIGHDSDTRKQQKAQFAQDLAKLNEELSNTREKQEAAQSIHDEILGEISRITAQIEDNQNAMYSIMNEQSNIKTENQRFQTMLEQLNIRKAQLSSKVIAGKSEESVQNGVINGFSREINEINDAAAKLAEQIQAHEQRITEIRNTIAEMTANIDKLQQQYHREKSRLESLRNIAERYDGYGNSIRRVMERKETTPGILGVIADIVKVEKKYEVAIETALGGTIQNIVTDNESTAKELISYLKENKFGRATFLPLSSISGRNTLEKDPAAKEPGVVNIASSLVRVSFEYENLVKYLLGRILVVDNIDHALAIARKYKYSLRIVTLEGEQLNPGGSMTGGAFKNSSNLLGRRREIEELKASVAEISNQLENSKAELAQTRKDLAAVREENDAANKELREKQLVKNTAQMNYKQAVEKKDAIVASYQESSAEIAKLDTQIQEIKGGLNSVTDNLQALDHKNADARNEVTELNKTLDGLRQREARHNADTESIHLQYSTLTQKENFIKENIERLDWELENLDNELVQLKEQLTETASETGQKQEQITSIQETICLADTQIQECADKITELKKNRDVVMIQNKDFFDKRETLSKTISELDKECYRLNSQKDKLEEANEAQSNYMWSEYEITYRMALELRDEAMTDLADMKRRINQLKASIRGLGDVSVNSIEEYKEVSERYEFLKTQHDDLMKAEEALMQVIDELDNGMRIQFTAKFEEIKAEFDVVFKELFGGGRGTIELVEGEDVLEAGITIVSQPPGKKLQNMMQLSGGEKALTAISLLFAIQNLKPSPFCLLDEIEAALDDSNVSRYASYLHKLTEHTQFIVITHRRGTMSAADRLYGITMQEKGVSTLVSVDLIENELEDGNKEERVG